MSSGLVGSSGGPAVVSASSTRPYRVNTGEQDGEADHVDQLNMESTTGLIRLGRKCLDLRTCLLIDF